jgi:hypothetical protein
MLYIGWTEDGEWTNYTVETAEAGEYRISALYAKETRGVVFDVDGVEAAACPFPVDTGDWHSWNYAPVGKIAFGEAGLHLLTMHYVRGNNLAFFAFERI